MSNRKKIIYSETELLWIKKHCALPRKKAHEMFCSKFHRHDVNLKNYNGLCKRKGWVTGRTGQYTTGNIPFNKGKQMPYNANSASTQFKKGNLPHNTKYLGHERITKDGYVEISIASKNPHTGAATRYVLKHKYLWEKEHGKLPADMCLKCLDGNRQNTSPDNWKAIPRGALPFLNGHRGHSYKNAHPETRMAVLALAELKHRKTAMRGKNSTNSER